MKLNPEQQLAADTTDGAVMIIAGAGTGKTKTVTARIIGLLATGVAPWNILAVTFTNKAASEMKERIAHHLPHGIEMPLVCTFHGLGVLMLRQFGTQIGIDRSFSIVDRDDQMKMLEAGVKQLGLDSELWSAKRFRERISWLTNHGTTISELRANSSSDMDRYTASVWEYYETEKKKAACVDFDDLLQLPLQLLQKFPTVREYYQKKFRYIHVDEYQDTSGVQDEMIALLADYHKNICVVGDTDQTIYSWRGAQIKNMLQFHKRFPDVQIVTLSKNYRSTQTIIAAGNALIAKNTARIPKDLISVGEPGNAIVSYRAYSEKDEASWVATQLQTRHANGVPWRDMAILYRNHYLSRTLEESLLHAGIPYSVLGTKFFDRKEIKDMIAWIRASRNRKSLPDMKRVVEFPKRGIGKVAWATITTGDIHLLRGAAQKSYATITSILDDIYNAIQHKSPSEVVLFAAQKSGIIDTLAAGDAEDHERLLNIQELVTYAKDFDALMPIILDDDTEISPMEQFLERVALMSDQDGLTNDTEGGVRMMTVHAAKGLEFDTVAIIGLEQGIFPAEKEEGGDPEEERRLMYVAVTRAKQQLYISCSLSRRIFGSTCMQSPSEFITDIPPELVRTDKPVMKYLDDDFLPSIY